MGEYTVRAHKEKCNGLSIENILRLHGLLSKPTRSMNDIECITDQSGDTLIYVYNNPDGGWIMHSSDSRLPAIIAQSDEGSFSDVMTNESSRKWIMSIASDIKTIKHIEDDELNFTPDEIEHNQSFWSSMTTSDEMMALNPSIEQTSIQPLDPKPIIPPGHYVYSHTFYYTETYDSVPRMTTTDWHQDSPYNKYCPDVTKGTGKAPAGCAAIATAQLLYFMHQKYGVPRTAPSKAYCNGNIDNYSWSQYNHTVEIWDEMSSNPEAAAPMIADIGRRLNMSYGNSSSSAYTKDIPDKVLKEYGISGEYVKYDEEILKSNLLNGLPVLIETFANDADSNGIIGHVFIADRYKRIRIKYETHYRWEYDYMPDNQLIPVVKDKIVTGYQSPEISMIGFNWGWGPYYNSSSEWYSLTGEWTKNYGGVHNWNVDRAMVYVTSINL